MYKEQRANHVGKGVSRWIKTQMNRYLRRQAKANPQNAIKKKKYDGYND